MSKKATEYIEELDFDGAFDRYNSTTKRWKGYWFDVCCQILDCCKNLAKKYIVDKVAKTISERVATKQTKYSYDIVAEVPLLDDVKEKCYLFEFYDTQGKLVCSKVGTTTRKVVQRLKEELRSPTYKSLNCARAVIKRVYNCGNVPAEGLESYFRAHYIKEFPNSFKKNDRFMNEFFNFEVADRLVADYLGC